MIGVQNNKARNFEKSFSGCTDRMVNSFEVNTGPSFSRSRLDAAGVSKIIGDTMDDKPVMREVGRTSSNKNSNTTPMKMLIAQELLNDVEAKHKSPSVVAKLMGLDAVPQQRSDSVAPRIHSRSYSCDTLPQAGRTMESSQQGDHFREKQMRREVHQHSEQTGYKDVYEVWQQSQSQSCLPDIYEEKERRAIEGHEKKMSIGQQNLIEAKRLTTDETLRKSQVQDALEVLSSNKDLFLKFLQEPNSLFSQKFYDLDSIPASPETKRITLLKPSKMVREMDELQIKKPSRVWKENERHQNIHGRSPTTAEWRSDVNHAQRTRIVVLKPSIGKHYDLPPSMLPTTPCSKDFFEEPEDEPYDAKEIAKEITRQIRENLSSRHRDETLFSSVCSNGYIGDESSSHKSHNEFAVEDFSDCEVVSPTSWHSWDGTNKYGTPASSSSFSPGSCSRESRVSREAKKRLSQRWARMELNENSREKMHVRSRSSNTLGEMLAFSGPTKLVNIEEDNIYNDQELGESSIRLTVGDESPRNLSRSKSLPVPSTLNGARINVELDPKDQTIDKDTKTSFKGKLSSLLFSKSKKPSNTQSKDESQATPSAGTCPPSRRDSGSTTTGVKQGCFSYKEGLSVTKRVTSSNSFEDQAEPSPFSVLDSSFEGDSVPYFTCFGSGQGSRNSGHSIKPNVIDKSPPIGSISRTCSFEDSRSESAHPYLSTPLASSEPNHEQDWFLFVQTLLSMAAGFHGETHFESYLGKSCSSESPLDPLLRKKYINLDCNEFLPEDIQRQLRSSRMLVFDCVNEALVNITSINSKPLNSEDYAFPLLVNQVWSLIKERFFDETGFYSNDHGEIRKEVAGEKWNDGIKLERGDLEKEIAKRLVEELVEEVGVEFGLEIPIPIDSDPKKLEYGRHFFIPIPKFPIPEIFRFFRNGIGLHLKIPIHSEFRIPKFPI